MRHTTQEINEINVLPKPLNHKLMEVYLYQAPYKMEWDNKYHKKER